MRGWAPHIIGAIGEPTTDTEGMLHAFFVVSPVGRAAGERFLGRIFPRTTGRNEEATWQTRDAQYDAVLKRGTPNFGMLQRLAAVRQRSSSQTVTTTG